MSGGSPPLVLRLRAEAVFLLRILYRMVPGYTNRGFEEYVFFIEKAIA